MSVLRGKIDLNKVTDLVSLDWCETKFLYTLEGGKKRRTAGTQGMRLG